MRYQAPRGTQDVLPADVHRWLRLESTFRHLVARYGYQELRTPTFEDTELFVHSSGDTSDIVTKQMYSFLDKGDRNITLKPEGTAPAVRAIIEHSLVPPGTVGRFSYVTPIFRYERPQKGRLREAHQVGLELVGSSSPVADAEVIDVTVRFYQEIGITDVQVLLNSIGRDECRRLYRAKVLEHMSAYLADQPVEAREKAERNPLRLLDSKDPVAQEALTGLPPITDFLEDDSRANFERLQNLLTLLGVPYVIDDRIVRGLDYYTETVFEVQSTSLGAQSSLCGGGRYDNLVRDLGGAATPSVGVAMGVERALIVLDGAGAAPRPHAFVATATPEVMDDALRLAALVRSAGAAAIVDPDGKSLKSQLRQADRANAMLAVIVGPEELAKGIVQVRDLSTSRQDEIPLDQVAEYVVRYATEGGLEPQLR